MARELIYRVSINTSDAKRAAANVRSTMENELRQITVGKLDVSAMGDATAEAHRLRLEFEAAALAAGKVNPNASAVKVPTAATPTAVGTGFDDQAIGQLKKIALGYLSIQAVMSGIGKAVDLAQLDTQAKRTGKSFEILSDSAGQAEVNVLAIKQASNGTVSTLKAMEIGTQSFALNLANSADDLAGLTRTAKIITLASPVIKDMGDALTQLALFSSNATSFARADQLAVGATEVKERMKELQSENAALDDSSAKLVATQQILEEKFGAVLDSAEAQATGIEKLTTAWDDYLIALASSSGVVQSVSGYFAEMLVDMTISAAGAQAQLGTIFEFLTNKQASLAKYRDGIFGAPADDSILGNLFDNSTNAGDIVAVDYALETLKNVQKAVGEGVPGTDEYVQKYKDIIAAWREGSMIAPEVVSNLKAIDAAIASAVADPQSQQQMLADQIAKAEEDRQKRIAEQAESIQKAVQTAAAKSISTGGLDQAIALYRDQKAKIDDALQELAAQGFTNLDEIEIAAVSIVNDLTAPFDEIEAAINVDNIASGFNTLEVAAINISSSFVDFLPAISSARDELFELGNEMSFTGEMSDEQAARLEYLSAVAYSVADGTSQLGQVVNELGSEFLESNSHAAALVDKMFEVEASFRAGLISADVYAGVTAALGGDLLTLAQNAGIATSSIWALTQAQLDMASAGSISVGAGVASNIATQQSAIARDNNRAEMERVAKEEAAQAKKIAQYNDRAARSAAKTAESAAKKAGSELEKAAKKAGQELINALKGVEGLFDASSVTEGDMALGSAYKDKADEYLRRLRDEVENGVDWPDVSIEEAAAAIEGLGLEAAGTKEAILAQFTELHNSSALYANEENIGKFINDEAVQYGLKLQELAAQGEANIFAHFGVVQEEAISSATGGSAGGGSALAPLELDPIEPANIIDVDPFVEGIQTGLEDYAGRSATSIKQALEATKEPIFDASRLFGGTGSTGGKLSGALSGKAGQAEITITATPEAAQIGAYLSKEDTTGSAISIAPTIELGDYTEQQAALAELLAVEITPTIAPDSALSMVIALGEQLSKQTTTLLSHGSNIGGNIKAGIVKALGLGDEDAVQIDIAMLVGNNLQAQQEKFVGQGKGIGALLSQGIREAFANTDTAQAAGDSVGMMGMAASITSVSVAEDATIPDIGVLAVLNKFAIDETALREVELTVPVKVKLAEAQAEPGVDPATAPNSITPLITSINTQIRASTDDIKREGASVAMILVAGIIAHWQGGAIPEEGGGTGPIAGALMTSVSTQLTTAQNMFYALGFIPAGSIESGFKAYGYTGMDSGILDSITTGIRTNAENYKQRGGTIGAYVQRGLNDSFSGEVGLSLAVAAGAAWGGAFQKGVLNQLSAGSGLVTAITDKVLEGIATEMEQP